MRLSLSSTVLEEKTARPGLTPPLFGTPQSQVQRQVALSKSTNQQPSRAAVASAEVPGRSVQGDCREHGAFGLRAEARGSSTGVQGSCHRKGRRMSMAQTQKPKHGTFRLAEVHMPAIFPGCRRTTPAKQLDKVASVVLCTAVADMCTKPPSTDHGVQSQESRSQGRE